MADIVDSAISSVADLRKDSVGTHRAKNRKMRYRNVNMLLLGEPQSPLSTTKCGVWNDRNKFKMPNPNAMSGGDSCACSSCRGERQYQKKRLQKRRGVNLDDAYDGYDEQYDYDNSMRDGVDGVLYSFDRMAGPSHGSQILTQALDRAIDKMETKQLEKLVKDEYDIVQSDESGSSEDDEYEFV